MDAQTMNYFSRLIEDTKNLIVCLQKFDNRIQEAYDRRLDVNLPTDEEFLESGDLDHLTRAKLAALLDSRNTLVSTLVMNDREGWNDLFEVIR